MTVHLQLSIPIRFNVSEANVSCVLRVCLKQELRPVVALRVCLKQELRPVVATVGEDRRVVT